MSKFRQIDKICLDVAPANLAASGEKCGGYVIILQQGKTDVNPLFSLNKINELFNLHYTTGDEGCQPAYSATALDR